MGCNVSNTKDEIRLSSSNIDDGKSESISDNQEEEDIKLNTQRQSNKMSEKQNSRRKSTNPISKTSTFTPSSKKNQRRRKSTMRRTVSNGITIVDDVKKYLPSDITKETIYEMVENALQGQIEEDSSKVIQGQNVSMEQVKAIAETVWLRLQDEEEDKENQKEDKEIKEEDKEEEKPKVPLLKMGSHDEDDNEKKKEDNNKKEEPLITEEDNSKTKEKKTDKVEEEVNDDDIQMNSKILKCNIFKNPSPCEHIEEKIHDSIKNEKKNIPSNIPLNLNENLISLGPREKPSQQKEKEEIEMPKKFKRSSKVRYSCINNLHVKVGMCDLTRELLKETLFKGKEVSEDELDKAMKNYSQGAEEVKVLTIDLS